MNYKQIAEHERYIIKYHLDRGLSLREIGTNLKKSHTTISREINRNTGKRGYRPKQAHEFFLIRQASKISAWKFKNEIKQKIKKYLKKYWSPEQIVGWFTTNGKTMVSLTTIYKYISEDKKNGGFLWKYLRHGHKKYRKPYGSGASTKHISSRVSIDDRPEVVDEKSRIGDWEIDTVIGKNHKGALITIVERKSKFLVMRMCKTKHAIPIANKIIDMLKPYKDRVLTITSDNGTEFSGHELFGKKLNADVYFAHPYSSWERGLNENTNGLIRQFYRKGVTFTGITARDVAKKQELLNTRPRKDLEWKTPEEVFLAT